MSISLVGCMKDRDKFFVFYCMWVYGGLCFFCVVINRWGIECDYLYGWGGLVNFNSVLISCYLE